MTPLVAIGDLASDLRSGFACGEQDEDGVVQFRMNNVGRDGTIDWAKLRRVPGSAVRKGLTLSPGDILFNATNSPELVGKTALFTGFDEDVTFSNHFVRLRPKPETAHSGYVARWLQSQFAKGTFGGMCRQWVNQATVTKNQLATLQLPLPPLPEQRRIAAILDKADALRRKRKRTLELLDGLTQAIFLEMFGDPSSNPKNLRLGRIGDLLDGTQYGTNEKAGSAGSHPILRMGNITNRGQIVIDDLKYIDLPPSDIARYTVRKGDILFNRTNSAELVGKTAVVNSNEAYAYAGYLVRARVKRGSTPEYIAGYLNSAHGKATLRGMAKSIVGMANINAREMQSIAILIPSEADQRVYQARLKAIAHQASLGVCIGRTAGRLFESLQHRAFSGQL